MKVTLKDGSVGEFTGNQIKGTHEIKKENGDYVFLHSDQFHFQPEIIHDYHGWKPFTDNHGWKH